MARTRVVQTSDYQSVATSTTEAARIKAAESFATKVCDEKDRQRQLYGAFEQVGERMRRGHPLKARRAYKNLQNCSAIAAEEARDVPRALSRWPSPGTAPVAVCACR